MQSTRAAAPATPQGSITARYYLGIGGVAVSDLTGNAKFPNSPDMVRYEPYFEAWAGGDISTAAPADVRNDYGVQLVGYFYPATAGDYTFYISADDGAALYLSTDDNPANKRLIAAEPAWNNPREYQTPGSNATGRNTDAPENTSATYTGTQWATGNKITLQAGKAYYIEALMKEAGGGDNLSVSIDGQLPIAGDRLSPFAVASAPTIVAQPKDAAVIAGGTARFSVGLDIPPGATLTSIKWQKNGVDIPNSDSTDLAVPTTAADNNAKIKAIVTTSAGTLTSSEVTLSVATFANEFTPGIVKFEAYTDIGGTAIDALTGSDKYIAGTPDDVRLLAAVDSPNSYGENYGAKVSGFIVPPESGSYNFFLRSDDASQLWLSPDETEANAVMIAEETGCCDAFKEPDDTLAPSFETSTAQNLQAGKRYAFYALVKEAGGGDYVQVAARKEGDTTAAASLRPLSGLWIGANAKPSLGDPQITQQPQALPRLIEGRSGVLSVQGIITPTAYNFPLVVQWQRNGQDIPGATGPTLVLRNATAAQSGNYRAVVSAPSGKSVTSAEVAVAVVPDTFPPEIGKAGSVMKGNIIELGLGFDEPVDEASASAAANYSLSKGTVSKVRFEKYANPMDAGATVSSTHGVVLETTGLAKGDSVTITVMNVKDEKNNAIPAAGVTKTITATAKMTWVATGGNDYQEGASTNPAGFDQPPANYYDNVVALGEDKDFDLISGGSANWNNYDEATFVYEKITGDFDRVARVEYQDPSSQWARAGILARKTLDENVTRAQVEGGYEMSQNITVRVNPTVQWNGAAGNNAYEWVWRDTDGGNYSSAGGQAGVPYPNAWMRIQRTGQTFTAFASSDGVTWNNIGTHTFPTETPLPADLFVGPYFAPELTNNDSWKIGHAVVVKFRDYGPFQTGPPPGDTTLGIAEGAGGQLSLTFTGGRLQVATRLGPNADWTDVAGATSPHQVNPSGAPVQFYRVISP